MDQELTPEQVARVLRRASELAADDERPRQSGLSSSAVVAAAAEVGIPVAAVERAIAIEQLGATPPGRRGDRLVGPGLVVVDGRLPMGVAEAMSRLDDWLTSGHHLRRERWTAREGEWRRREGVIAAGTRAARGATGEGRLGEVRSLRVMAREDGAGTMIRVTVDRSAERNGWLTGGSSIALLGTGATVVGALAATPFILLAAPVALGAGAGMARAGRTSSDKTERELRRLLDAVGRRVTPTSLGQEIKRWVRRRP